MRPHVRNLLTANDRRADTPLEFGHQLRVVILDVPSQLAVLIVVHRTPPLALFCHYRRSRGAEYRRTGWTRSTSSRPIAWKRWKNGLYRRRPGNAVLP